jgi:DnaJ-class molecular chaperone
MTYPELQQALAVFGLSGRASLAELKARHRELVKRLHPDTGTADPAGIRQVNAAYRILQSYVATYRFSFAEEEFYEQNPDERLRRQFGNDPIWGGGQP